MKAALAAALVLILLAVVIFVEESHLIENARDHFGEFGAEDVAERHARLREERVASVDQDAVVEVLYAEHLLASWVLESAHKAPWSAFHSGIAFLVKDRRTGAIKREHLIDFTATLTESVAAVLHPWITPNFPKWMPRWFGLLYARMFASYDIQWMNNGVLRFFDQIPSQFTNFTRIGHIDGNQLNEIIHWLRNEYAGTKTAFDPVEIMEANHTYQVLKPSSMCHDVFYQTLDKLVTLGFKPEVKSPIFRDHIMVFASSFEKVEIEDTSTRREVVRYFRLFQHFMIAIDEEFTNIRGLLEHASAVKVQPFLFKENEYLRINLVEPFVNYCYLSIAMPPNPKSTLANSEHLCALPEKESPRKVSFSSLIESLRTRHMFLYALETLLDSKFFWAGVVSILVILLTG